MIVQAYVILIIHCWLYHWMQFIESPIYETLIKNLICLAYGVFHIFSLRRPCFFFAQNNLTLLDIWMSQGRFIDIGMYHRIKRVLPWIRMGVTWSLPNDDSTSIPFVAIIPPVWTSRGCFIWVYTKIIIRLTLNISKFEFYLNVTGQVVITWMVNL